MGDVKDPGQTALIGPGQQKPKVEQEADNEQVAAEQLQRYEERIQEEQQ